MLFAFAAFATLCGASVIFGRTGPVLDTPYHEPSYELRICPDPKIDPIALNKALDWWSDHGVWFVVDPGAKTGKPCAVVTADPTLDDLGFRGLTVFGGEPLVKVADGRDALAIAHELGHVAGYGHTPLAPSGVMMAPRHAGWSDRGLPHRTLDPQGW